MCQQVFLDGPIQGLSLLGAQMPDRAIHQFEARADGAPADLAHLFGVANAFHMAVRAEFQVNLVGVIDQLLSFVFPDERGKIPAHLMGKGKLPVGKRAGAGKARRDMAVRTAIHAPVGDNLRAAPLFNRLALFHDGHALAAAFADHFKRGENARGSCSDDDDIFVHAVPARGRMDARNPFPFISPSVPAGHDGENSFLFYLISGLCARHDHGTRCKSAVGFSSSCAVPATSSPPSSSASRRAPSPLTG